MTTEKKIVCPCCGSDSVKITRDCPDDHGLCWETTYKCSQCGLQRSEEDWHKNIHIGTSTLKNSTDFENAMIGEAAKNNVRESLFFGWHANYLYAPFETEDEAVAAEFDYLKKHPSKARYSDAERMGLVVSPLYDNNQLALFENTILRYSTYEYNKNKLLLQTEACRCTGFPQTYPPAPTIWETLLELSKFGKTELQIDKGTILIKTTCADKVFNGACPANYPVWEKLTPNAAEIALEMLSQINAYIKEGNNGNISQKHAIPAAALLVQ